MPGPIAIVTDSTAYLPAGRAEQWGIAVVPVQVIIGGEAYDEGGGVSSETVAEALRAWRPVTTSRPTPNAFLDIYNRAADLGASGLVSVHLSAEMSGTVGSAELAAKEARLPVIVLDSRTLGMAMGYAVLAGAAVAADGGTMVEVATEITRRCQRASAFFYLDTLEYLRRGGRIGAAAALLGSALSVKPLLHLVDGHIAPLEKVRTTSRALARLEEIAISAAGGAPVDLAVHHLASPVRAEALAERLAARVPGLRELQVSEVGAVVGAHVGPGMLAVAVSPL